MTESSPKEPAPTSTTVTPAEAPTDASTTAVEELKKEFSRNNQHNLSRDKKEVEPILRRTRRPNKKEYQRSRGRNKR